MLTQDIGTIIEAKTLVTGACPKQFKIGLRTLVALARGDGPLSGSARRTLKETLNIEVEGPAVSIVAHVGNVYTFRPRHV